MFLWLLLLLPLLLSSDMWNDAEYAAQQLGGSAPGYVDFGGSHRRRRRVAEPSQETASGPRIEFLDMHCGGLFPSYFKTIYTLIGRIKLCQRESSKIRVSV